MPPEAETLEKPDATAATAAKADAAATEGKTEGQAAPAEGKDKAAAAITGADGKAVDAGAEVDAGKKGGDPSLLDDGGEEDGDADAADDTAATDKDAKAEDDKTAAAGTFAEVRAQATEKYLAKRQAQLAKTLTAAELPKALAKEKAKFEATLARYGNLDDALAALVEKDGYIRSGKKKELPEDASDEEKAADRKERGIPAEPKAYEVPKVPGHIWSDGATPMLDSFKEVAHVAELTQAQAGAMTTWFAKQQMAAEEALAEQKATRLREAELATRDRRRDAWGPESKAAFNLTQRLLRDPAPSENNIPGMPLALKETLKRAEVDGIPFLFAEGVEPWLTELGLAKYGDDAMPRGDAVAQNSSREEELAKIRDTDIERYRREKNGKGQTLMQEMLDLQRAKDKRGGQRAA